MERFLEPPPRKASFAEVVRDFLNTPGYSTSQVREYGSHEAYMKTFVTKEQPMEETKEGDPLEQMAAEITEVFGKSSETFMLGEPLTLTVLKEKGYSKAPHVGSEDFAPVKAYPGKRGKMIYVFKPVMATSYIHMEMDETQAQKSLIGFKEFMKENMGEIVQRLSESRKEAADRKEREAMADRYEKYEGFGSW
jgi:hypothetical protein